MRDFSCYEKNIYEKLDDRQLKSVMEQYGLRFCDDLTRKIPLLRTPFLLELYCYTRKKLSYKKYDYIHFPSYRGEIIHNFVTASLTEYKSIHRKDKNLHSLYINRILPFIAYNIEKEHIYAISIEDFNSIINKYNLSEEKREEFLENYFFLRKDKGNISFTHFDFRNYFSAMYIKEKIAEEINAGSLNFPELACRLFSLPLRHMIGEILSERPGEKKKTLLDSVLDRLRGRDLEKGDYTLQNIIDILKDRRIELTDTDLSFLDLRNVSLNNLLLGCNRNGPLRGANLKGAKINSSTFFYKDSPGYPSSVSYSPDGKKVAGACYEIIEWNRETGEKIKTYKGHRGKILSLSYSPDGEKLISAGEDKKICLWDVKTGEAIRTYCEDFEVLITVPYTSVTFSPDSNRILVGRGDIKVVELDVNTGETLRSYEGYFSACYSPDGKRVLTFRNDLVEWNNEARSLIQENTSEFIKCACYSRDEKKILVGYDSGFIREWNILTGEWRTGKSHYSAVESVFYSPDGKYIIACYYSGILHTWDAQFFDCIRMYKLEASVAPVIYSPDGKSLTSSVCCNSLKEWDSFTGECIRTYLWHHDDGDFDTFAVSPDGKRLVAGGKGIIKEWDILKGTFLRSYKGHSGHIWKLYYVPDGGSIVSYSSDEVRIIWDMDTGEAVKIDDWDSSWFSPVTVIASPDGKRSLSESYPPGNLKEYNGKTGKIYRIYNGNFPASYSPDGEKFIFSSGNTIEERYVENGEIVRIYEGHSPVKFLCYSPDGNHIVSFRRDNTIELVDVKSGKSIMTLYVVPGLYINGVDLNDALLRLDDKEKLILKQYGAILDKYSER